MPNADSNESGVCGPVGRLSERHPYEQALPRGGSPAVQVLDVAVEMTAPTTTNTPTTTTIENMPTNPSAMLAKLKAWELANPLRNWRTENGVSRQTVAGALGVTHTAVVAWEAGSNRPTDENMEAIARLLGVSSTKLTEAWDDWRASSPAAR